MRILLLMTHLPMADSSPGFPIKKVSTIKVNYNFLHQGFQGCSAKESFREMLKGVTLNKCPRII